MGLHVKIWERKNVNMNCYLLKITLLAKTLYRVAIFFYMRQFIGGKISLVNICTHASINSAVLESSTICDSQSEENYMASDWTKFSYR